MIASHSFRVNARISAPRLRLISEHGLTIGVVSLQDALAQARDRGLDLVEVSPKEDPPVAKILDYGKLKYQEDKRKRKARQAGAMPALKEVRMRPKIDDHDRAFKIDHACKFLQKGHRVKVTVQFSGREITHQGIGHDIIRQVLASLNGVGLAESNARLEGRNLSVILKPVAA